MHQIAPSVAFLLLLCSNLFAQRAVDPSNRYFRLVCLVHLTGTGEKGQAVMPDYVKDGVEAAKAASEAAMLKATTENSVQKSAELAERVGANTSSKTKFADPLPGTPKVDVFAAARPGILAWSMQPTDDKQMAIVYIVAADRHAFDPIVADKRPEVRVFEIGKDSKEEIEKELRRFKKDFSLDSFRVMVQ